MSLDAEATRRWTRTLRSGASDSVDFRLDLDAAETASLVRLLAERRRSDPVESATPEFVAADDDDAAWETVTSGKRSGGRRNNGSASNAASTERRRGGVANPNGSSGNEGFVAAAGEVAEVIESATVSEPAAPPKAPKGWAAILTGRASSATLTPSEAAAKAAEEAAEEAKRAKAAAEAEAAARAEEDRERRAAREQRERERKAKEEKSAAASKAEQAPEAERKPASAAAPAAAPAAAASVESSLAGDGNKNVGKPFAGWASVVSGKTPDPAKEGWKTLVGGKLDAEQSPTATVTLDGAVGVKKVDSTTETRSASPPAILAPTKKPQGASKPATAAAEPSDAAAPAEPPELRKAWTGWAVAAPPPKVDLKAEMQAAEATRAATPPSQLGKKDAAASGSPRRDADDKKGAANADSKKGGKTAGNVKAGNQPPPPAGPRPGVGGRSFSPPPPPASPPPTMPAPAHAPARPFVAAPAPPNAPAESLVDDAFAKMTGDAPAAVTDAENRAALAARLGAEMLEIAHVKPRGAKGATLRAERRATDLLIRAVNAIVQSLYPQASVEVFGSFPTASWTPGASNLDMALCLPESATSTPQAKIDALNSLAVALRSNGWVTDVNVVPSAFRPLIMMNTHSAFFQAVPGGGAAGAGDAANGNGNGNAGSPNAAAAPPLPPGPPPPGATLGLGLGQGGVGLPLEVHISVKDRNHKGAATVKFLQQAEAEYPALAPVLAVQKAYLASRGLRGVYKGGIGSYSLALLALHALQRKAHEDKTREAAADDASPDAADARVLGESMLRFLEFYGHGVDLTRSSIKVHALRPVGKAAKKAAAAAEANGGAAAVEWGVLSSPSHAPDGSPRAVVGGGMLQVQDPIQAGHNAGGGCFGVAGVQASFREQMQKLAGLPEDASLLQHLLAPPPGSPPAAAKVCVV